MRHPLEIPAPASAVLAHFLRTRCIDPAQPPLALLGAVAGAFAQLPFENLTKILRDAEAGRPEEARRTPAEVLGDHEALGTGGTCFALTSALLHLVRALGWPAEPILADRRYGADTHSALLVWIDGRPHLLDPGYLIVTPLPLPSSAEVIVPTPFNQLQLTPRDGGARVELRTVQHGQTTYRLTFKTAPADAGTFLRAWDQSFDAEMMHYPVLSRVVGARQLYLQKRHLMVRGVAETQRTELPDEQLAAAIAHHFHIAPAVVGKALALLKRRGDLRGRAASA